MSRRFRNPTLFAVLPLMASAAAPALQAADTCDALYHDSIKTIQTSHHVYSTTTMHGGQPQTGEVIYAGGEEYLQLHGKWMRSPISHQDMLDAAQEKLKTHSDVCTATGDQVVDGQAVSVYEARNKEMGTEQIMRIFKSSGLMQGSSLTLPDGTLVETRYEYDRVQPPPGIK